MSLSSLSCSCLTLGLTLALTLAAPLFFRYHAPRPSSANPLHLLLFFSREGGTRGALLLVGLSLELGLVEGVKSARGRGFVEGGRSAAPGVVVVVDAAMATDGKKRRIWSRFPPTQASIAWTNGWWLLGLGERRNCTCHIYIYFFSNVFCAEKKDLYCCPLVLPRDRSRPVPPNTHSRIRLESLIGDSNTLIEELKDAEPDNDKDAAAGTNTNTNAGGKGKGKRDNTNANTRGKGGGTLADGGAGGAGAAEEALLDGSAEVEGEADGGAGKGKKKKKKKKGKGTPGEKVRSHPTQPNPTQAVLPP